MAFNADRHCREGTTRGGEAASSIRHNHKGGGKKKVITEVERLSRGGEERFANSGGALRIYTRSRSTKEGEKEISQTALGTRRSTGGVKRKRRKERKREVQ